VASLAERYESGQRRKVWDELVAMGPDVFAEPVRADAEAVATLTMQRAAANVATLVVRLTLMGYRFGGRNSRNTRRRTIEELGLRDSLEAAGRDVSWVDAGDIEEHVMGWEAPTAAVEPELRKVDEALGPLPLSLQALVRSVDAVNLAGSFPEWTPTSYAYAFDDDTPDEDLGEITTFTDALNFNGISMINENFQPHAVAAGGRSVPPRSYALPVAANHLLGSNRPGDFHSILLPDPVADPVLDGVYGRPGIRLVEYLRVAFAWGGFPGLEFADGVPPQIAKLRRDLLPI
jgi:hypothetical protein